MRHRDVIIHLAVEDIITTGIKHILERDYNGNIVGEEIKKCVVEIKKSYDMNYNNFREIIRRCI